MTPISKEVMNFVRACEAIHGRFALGEPFTPEERDIMEASGTELLSKLKTA